jgi:hypothetical protein
MNRRKLLRALLIVAVLLSMVAVATAALAQPNGTHERPWKASYGGTFEPDTHACSDLEAIPIYTVGYGEATHLGKMTIETWDCVNFIDGSISEGTVVFTAANGDELYGAFEGSVTGPPDDEGWVPFRIESDFDGGTGRFVNATGESVEVGRVFLTAPPIPPDGPTGLIEGTLTGIIAYDASDRSD